MKHFWSVLLALLFVFAVFGCKKQIRETPPAINPCFEADVAITYNEVNMTCHLYQKDFSDAEIEIFTPQELSGLKIVREENKCSLSFKEMNYQLDLSKFPKASFAQIMTDAYSKLVNSDSVKIQKQEKYWIYHGKINSGEFIITQNGDTGNVEKIEVPQVGMTAEFSNIKSIANEQ